MSADPLIVADRVTYRYGGTRAPVCTDFSWTVSHPGLVLVSGPNMMGKTTLLKLIAGHLTPQSGQLTVARPREYVPQEYSEALFPWRSVAWNIALPACIHESSGAPKNACESALAGLPILEEFRDIWDAFPQKLSGGGMHLVALARGFASRARVLLLDEPFTGLDAHWTGVAVHTISRYVNCDRTRLVLLVTHQLPRGLPPFTAWRIDERPFSALINPMEEQKCISGCEL
jgi:NitT/TauT family transport system ATP-binding protein